MTRTIRLVYDAISSVENQVKTRSLAGLLLLPIAVLAQQPSRQTTALAPPTNSKSDAVVKTPAQILDENRASIAVIVAAGNTSLKLGTGFFLQPDGLLLTNFHVVEGMDLVGVKTPGGSVVLWAKKAKGFDLDNDLVVLRVETSAVKSSNLGNSDQVRVGEQIVVVGNPEGLEQTVSNGLVSGIREVEGRRLFQISAPISEGSSGSPVFNDRGDVIGVAVSSLESGQNLNFAVPINYAKPLLTSMTENLISSLPKRSHSDAQARHSAGASDATVDPAKLAVQAMNKIADEIRACKGFSMFTATKKKKLKYYYRTHWDPPTDVRFDVKTSDSLVAPFEGIIEFSTHFGVSPCLRTDDEASCAADRPPFSITIRHRHVFRISESGVQLDYRNTYDDKRQDWVLEQGKPDACWETIGYH